MASVLDDAQTYAQTTATRTSRAVQNAVTNAQNDVNSEDMVRIHQDDRHDPENGNRDSDLADGRHVIKEATKWGVAEHDVSLAGLGGVAFVVMLFAIVLSITSFASNAWALSSNLQTSSNPDGVTEESQLPLEEGTAQIGLWESCICSKAVPDNASFHATQAMITIGFISIWVAILAIILYLWLCIKWIKKTYLMFIMLGASLSTVLFSFIGLVVFAATLGDYQIEATQVGWSYVLAMISFILMCVSTFLIFVHFRRSVPIC